MKLKNLLFFITIIGCFSGARAQDFFSTEPAENLFTFGVRAGVNASNRTFSKKTFEAWNVNSWGTGFQAGIIAQLNLRDYLAIQPGFFFESRSGNFAYAMNYTTNTDNEDTYYQLGHERSYNFTVPVMGIVRFNIAEEMKWLVEFGPYLQFYLHKTDGDQILILEKIANNTYSQRIAASNGFDFGFKIGTGLEFKNHYYFGIHYMAGCLNAWKDPKGGRNKAWTFSLGYNF